MYFLNSDEGDAIDSEVQEACVEERSAPKRILLVEDDHVVRGMLERILASEGYLVILGASGREMAALLDSCLPDLALIDFDGSDKALWSSSGVAAARNPMMPVVLLTGRPHEIGPAIAAQVDAFVEKPFNVSVLLETIEELLDDVAAHRGAKNNLPEESR